MKLLGTQPDNQQKQKFCICRYEKWKIETFSKKLIAPFLHSILRSNTSAHCSYLDIYISQNIRLCKGNFEGEFQTTLQAKGINFFIWKFRFIILIFLLFLAEFVKSTAFCTLLLLFQRVDMFELRFDAKITI